MSKAPQDPLAQEMMTLAGIAYGAPANIASYLADRSLATGGRWQLRWIAADVEVPVNFAFVAQDMSGGPSRVVVAIRGTYPNPLNPAYWDDASQDNPFGAFVDWPHPGGTGAQVSRGTWAGFQGLLGLTGSDGTSLTDLLADLPQGTTVVFTGHSLGGTLAPVLGQWASTLASRLAVSVVSFAGMTPGNAAFASLITDRTRRYYNDLDSVPFGWDSVLATKDFYQPAPQGGILYRAAIEEMASLLAKYGYAAVGAPQRLAGTLTETLDIPVVSFLIENLHQHLPDTYLTLLGAPLLPFTIGFGNVVAPKNHPLAAAARPRHIFPSPVFPAPAASP